MPTNTGEYNHCQPEIHPHLHPYLPPQLLKCPPPLIHFTAGKQGDNISLAQLSPWQQPSGHTLNHVLQGGFCAQPSCLWDVLLLP